MFVFICFLILASIGYRLFTKDLKYWKERGVKGPQPLPIFGNLLDFLFTPKTDLELKYYRNYGNFYGYFFGNTPVLVVGEPELIKSILVKDFHIFPRRRGVDTFHPIMKISMPNIVDFDDWKRIRSITTPTFTSSKMKLMYSLMEDCLNDLIVHLDELAKTKKVNFREIYGYFTLDVIASCAFATKLNSRIESGSTFAKHAKTFFRINPVKIFLLKVFPKSIFGASFGRQSEIESTNFYVNLIRQIIEKRKENDSQKFNDFLQLLIDADHNTSNEDIDCSESHHVDQGEEELQIEKNTLNVKFNSSNKKLNEDEVIAQGITFLMAAYETSAAALTCATYELAMNPDVQDKLREEISSSFNPNGTMHHDVLCRLPYLDAFVTEVLRRHPPAVKITRIASQEYKVGNTGITVYAGQQVDIPIYGIHHDENYYTNPFKFDPERFMPHNRQNLTPYTYFVFGAGPRNCVGIRFALLEVKLALARLVQRFTFFKCNETDVPLISDSKSFINSPKRMILGIDKRK